MARLNLLAARTRIYYLNICYFIKFLFGAGYFQSKYYR